VTYCFKCPECGEQVETPDRESAPICIHDDEHRYVPMVRDYQAENAQVDEFSLRQDVRGNRRHRADPLPPDEAHRVNQERRS